MSLKKVFLSLFILITVILFTTDTFITNTLSVRKNKLNKKCRIGLISPVDQAFHGKVKAGFLAALEQSPVKEKYRVDILIPEERSNGLLAGIVDEAIKRDYDVLFSIGMFASQITKSITTKRSRLIPTVFTGTGDPMKLGLVKTLEEPGYHLTGVEAEEFNHLLPAGLLCHIKPATKKVLLPYDYPDPTGRTDGYVASIKNFLASKNVETIELPVANVKELGERLPGFIKRVDSLIYLDGTLIGEALPLLIKLCNRHRVTLFAHGLYAVKEGAALGIGGDPGYLGKRAFALCRKIAEEGLAPADIPVQIISDGDKVGINFEALEQQGVELSPLELFVLKHSVVYKDHSIAYRARVKEQLLKS